MKLADVADRLADRTGWGEAMVGGLLLGGATSLSGLATSVASAWNGLPELAISNAAGGIAGQTVFLVVADITYRRANLEHAAASLENLLQGTILIGCLSLTFLAMAMPDIAVFGLHPVSYLIIFFYIYGLRVARAAQLDPGWMATKTRLTHHDEPDGDAQREPLRRLVLIFVGLALATAAAGYLLSLAAEGAVRTYGLNQGLLGTYATALLTSLPELVTTIAAVRRGALQLAVGGIIGGNSFDTLFIAASDAAYGEGSIYAAITGEQTLIIALSVVMTAILLMGLLRRQRQGPGHIGFETIALLLAYLGGAALLFWQG